MRTVLLSIALASVAATSFAQGDQPNRLPGVKRLKCQFTASAGGSWTNGEPQARVKNTGVLSVEFSEIDTDESSARTGSVASGTNHIVAQLRGWTLHFLDAEPDGGLNVTTVFSRESRDKKLKAVHTRTKYLPISVPGFVAEPEASQYYGECEILQ